MAEIRIQEKKKPVWPWILLVIIIIIAAILIYMYLTRGGTVSNNDETVPADTTLQSEPDTGEMKAFRSSDERKAVEAKERIMRDFIRMPGSILSDIKNTARAV